MSALVPSIDDAIENILDGSMLPPWYALMQHEARLTDDERRILVDAFRYLAEHDD